MYCFTNSISHGVEKYFPRLWGTGIFDAIFNAALIRTAMFCVDKLHFLFVAGDTINLNFYGFFVSDF